MMCLALAIGLLGLVTMREAYRHAAARTTTRPRGPFDFGPR